jgi:hypothetical protein
VWHELHPTDPGTTFDSTINHHAASTTMPNFAARLGTPPSHLFECQWWYHHKWLILVCRQTE